MKDDDLGEVSMNVSLLKVCLGLITLTSVAIAKPQQAAVLPFTGYLRTSGRLVGGSGHTFHLPRPARRQCGGHQY